MWNQYSHLVDAEVAFYIYRFLICRGVLRGTLITLFLADDLHINILKFVAGHAAVVQPASINIVLWYKQAQQYSRTHKLGFIRGWSSQFADSHWSFVHITLTVERFNFHAFYKKCGSRRDLMSCSSHLMLQRRLICFLDISVFWKSHKIF